MQPIYGREFFEQQAGGSYRSAQLVLPLVFEQFNPRSVVDVGCGLGSWLKAAAELGAERVLGIDGDYVDRSQLMIEQTAFLAHDLAKPLQVPDRFDLALSLEVAEHLPIDAAGNHLDMLAQLSDLVLFSAAIPGQGGTGHINENWLEFWALRFAERGYLPIDKIRPRIWNKRFVEPWYRQNILLFANNAAISRYGLKNFLTAPGELMSIVHPEVFMLLLGLNNVVPFGPQHLESYYADAAEAARQMRSLARSFNKP